MEIETNDELPFLDVLLMKESNGELSHTVYRKATNTNRYLHADSHHHPSQKRSTLNSLVTRARRLADTKHLPAELIHLKETFLQNGYSMEEIEKAINRKPKQKEEKEKMVGKVIIPYVKGTSDKISQLLHKHRIETIFTTDKKTSSLFRSVKTSNHLENCGVYHIPCDCGLVYIGQTQKPIRERIKQHKYSEKSKQIWLSGVAKHGLSMDNGKHHTILYDATKTLVKETSRSKRFIAEAVEIWKHPENFNNDDGYNLSKGWITALETLKKEPRMHPSPDTSNLTKQTVALLPNQPILTHAYDLRSKK